MTFNVYNRDEDDTEEERDGGFNSNSPYIIWGKDEP